MLLLLLITVVLLMGVNGEIMSKKQRKAKEVEKKIKRLSEGTMKRIHGMR